jgi:hypothetical protein
MTWRQRNIPRELNTRLLAHLVAESNRREDWEATVDAVIVDKSLLEADEVPIDANPIFERCHDDPNVIDLTCEFSERDFLLLYDIVEDKLTKAKRGWKQEIGPIDGFLLFLH